VIAKSCRSAGNGRCHVATRC